ncbi:MAG: LamG domain-containing protein [Lentisphaerae bacterium]|nr:LamG domain-containing protein [Lentisphaerota bacterium]
MTRITPALGRRVILAAVLSFALGSAPRAAAAATPADACSFLADYSRPGSLDAASARGDAAATLRLAAEPVLDFDTMAHTQRGLVVGREAASVAYQTAGNLAVGRGSIELTLKPIDWNGQSPVVLMLLQTVVGGRTPLGKLFIYKYKESGLAAYLEYNDQGDHVFLSGPVPDWQPESWHHLVLTYDLPGEARLYLDGRQADIAPVPLAPSWPAQVSVGPYGEGFGRAAGRTSLGLVAFYDRPLTPSEVQSLAGSRLPDLARGDSAAAAAPVGTMAPRSPWHEQGRPALAMAALEPDVVLPPWTPIAVEADRLAVWGRRYDLGGDGLLAGAEATGAEILAGPVRLRRGGEAPGAVGFGPLQPVGAAADGQRRFRREVVAAAGLTGQVEILAEADGLLWYDLSLSADAPGELAALTLAVPLRPEVGELMHYVGAPTSYESQDLPRHSFSRAIPAGAGRVWESAFRTTVWVGNTHRGLLWCAESDESWWPKDRADALRLERADDGAVTLVLDLVTEPWPAGQPLRLRFGLMATPVRPQPDGWRAWTFSAQYDGRRGDERGSHLIYWPDEWRLMGLDPDLNRGRNLDALRAKVAADHAAGRLIIPYWTRLHAVARSGDIVEPDAVWMRQAWGTEPNRPGGGMHQFFRCATTSGWADYLVWCVEEWARIAGRLDGVYIDETQPIPNRRAESGGGYDAPDGTRRPTYEFFGSRRLYQRLMYATGQRHGRPATSVAHASATHTMQCLSPFAAMLIGEQYHSGYFTENPEFLPPPEDRVYYYSYALPMDRLRAECFGRQWGPVMVWLPCLKNQKDILEDPRTTRDMLSRVLQADMLIWPLHCNLEEVHRTWRIRAAFDIGNRAVTFTPYWENRAITADRDGVVVGVYRRPGEALLVVSNLNREAVTTRLHFDAVPRQVVEAETGTPLALADGAVTLDLPRNDYAMLRLHE